MGAVFFGNRRKNLSVFGRVLTGDAQAFRIPSARTPIGPER